MRSLAGKSVLLCSVLILFTGLLAGCGSGRAGSGGSDSRIHIVAAEDFYGEVAKAVGGDYVHVTSIIHHASADPHDFEMTPDVARKVDGASVVLYNGVGYDGWMDELVDAGSRDKKIIRVAEDILKKKNGDNEHVWYDPETMPKLADYLASVLSDIDPDHADVFKKNAQAYQQDIRPVRDLVHQLSEKTSGQRVDVSEPVFDYMLEALGYRISNSHFKQAVEKGTDPSPQDITKMRKDMEEKRIAFFVSNIQEMSPTVEKMVALAKRNDLPVVEVTETLPDGKDYKMWMLDILKQVEKAQK
ncbi:metal ABC transporter solute-binding protein [Sporolactobacillus sp. THM19-2]|uniref:metal ABC transporter solute-binding protein n=1 Tax=Sporolactobacillus sp. THM19-2 TaxID=2511171 RepID=UPI00102036B7|nr:metal ABC transporter solute-binding protein [Sporolactobacillus sp. THM19-2]RYL94434.1 metal ABC transporter substrate-binding protein [Sporolactobacillus sp. THM19-2]